MRRPALRGIIAATVLPMNRRFEPDFPALRAYLRWLLSEGVHGLAVNVDTGEGPHLLPQERLRVLETALDVVNGRVPVVAGLAPTFTENAVQTVRTYQKAGADAVMPFPLSAFRGKPLPPAVPLHYYRTLGDKTGMPLVLFQLQESLGGVEYPPEVLRALVRLPNIVAIKEATFQRKRYRETVALVRRANPTVTILTGNDNFIYESFPMGADGALIGFGTLATRMQVEMYDAHVAGDRKRAAALGRKVQRLADVIFAPPVRDYRVRLKEALRMLGIIPNSLLRPPLLPVSTLGRTKIRKALQSAGL